jgi:hypothetical protein
MIATAPSGTGRGEWHTGIKQHSGIHADHKAAFANPPLAPPYKGGGIQSTL